MNSEQHEFVTDKQWDAYCSRVFNANIKRCGSSLSPTGISRRAHSHIIEHRDNGLIVRKGWRVAMKIEEVTSQGEMQQCSKCGEWCRRTLNLCPTCERRAR